MAPALGLALLIPLAAARAETLAGPAGPSEGALVEGFTLAFFGAAGLAVAGVFAALFLVRGKEGA